MEKEKEIKEILGDIQDLGIKMCVRRMLDAGLTEDDITRFLIIMEKKTDAGEDLPVLVSYKGKVFEREEVEQVLLHLRNKQ